MGEERKMKNGKKSARQYALYVLYVLIGIFAGLVLIAGCQTKERYDLWNGSAPVEETPASDEEHPFAYTGNWYYPYTLDYGPKDKTDDILSADYSGLLYDYYRSYAAVERPGKDDEEAFRVTEDMNLAFYYYMYLENGMEEKAAYYREKRDEIRKSLTVYADVPDKTDELITTYLDEGR